MTAGARRVRPGRQGQPGLSQVPRPLRAARRHLRALLLLAVDRLAPRHVRSDAPRRASRRSATCSRMRPWSTVGATIRSHVGRPAGRADARPLHPVRRLVARPLARPCSAASPTCRPARASGIRGAARGPWPRPWSGWPASWASSSTAESGVRIDPDRAGRRRRGRRARRRRAGAPGGRRLELRLGADPSRAPGRDARGSPLREASRLRSGLLGRRPLPGPRPALRAAPPSQLRLLARSARGVRRHLPQGRAGPRPDLLRLRPAATEPDVAPPGGEALYVLVHTPYLRPHHDWKTTVSPLPPDDPRQAQDDRRARRHRADGSRSSAG